MTIGFNSFGLDNKENNSNLPRKHSTTQPEATTREGGAKPDERPRTPITRFLPEQSWPMGAICVRQANQSGSWRSSFWKRWRPRKFKTVFLRRSVQTTITTMQVTWLFLNVWWRNKSPQRISTEKDSHKCKWCCLSWRRFVPTSSS